MPYACQAGKPSLTNVMSYAINGDPVGGNKAWLVGVEELTYDKQGNVSCVGGGCGLSLMTEDGSVLVLFDE